MTRLPTSAAQRVGLALAIGLIVGASVAFTVDASLAVLSGIAAAEAIFVIAGWAVLWPLGPEATRANAQREGFRPVVQEALVVAITLAGLVSSVELLLRPESGDEYAAVGLAGVIMAWAALHLMYASRYAKIYYTADPQETSAHAEHRQLPAIDFNTGHPPTFQDFLYFSYVLGMTYAVSDTNVQSSQIRAVVIRHCLLSYLFGTSILATAINLVVGIVSG